MSLFCSSDQAPALAAQAAVKILHQLVERRSRSVFSRSSSTDTIEPLLYSSSLGEHLRIREFRHGSASPVVELAHFSRHAYIFSAGELQNGVELILGNIGMLVSASSRTSRSFQEARPVLDFRHMAGLPDKCPPVPRFAAGCGSVRWVVHPSTAVRGQDRDRSRAGFLLLRLHSNTKLGSSCSFSRALRW